MICPVQLASEMPSSQSGTAEHAELGKLFEDSDGAGDEGERSDFAGDGEEDYLVSGSGDHRGQRFGTSSAGEPAFTE